MRWGYTCSSEEFEASDLVRFAGMAEDVGFDFVSVSDHFHPWTNSQGHSPFVWSTLGAAAVQTRRIALGTGVTCPLIRIHPAIVAQAAATVSEMSNGRFFLGVGTGEALNEHIAGDRWPPIEERQRMLVEAVEIMRLLWEGDTVDIETEHYTLENARLFSASPHPIDVIWAASGTMSARHAAEVGDGLWSTSPDPEVVSAYRDAGGDGEVIGQVTLAYGADRDEAIRTAHSIWPNGAISGQLSQDLPTWTHFEQAARLVRPDDIADAIPCGPDPGPVIDEVRSYAEAGFTSLHFHQIGPDQRGFIDWWRTEMADALSEVTV
jgi:coenzyme F420-dependent glucose-6-phosphate dehydrogenase